MKWLFDTHLGDKLKKIFYYQLVLLSPMDML